MLLDRKIDKNRDIYTAVAECDYMEQQHLNICHICIEVSSKEQLQPEEFIQVLVDEMVRSGTASWYSDYLWRQLPMWHHKRNG